MTARQRAQTHTVKELRLSEGGGGVGGGDFDKPIYCPAKGNSSKPNRIFVKRRVLHVLHDTSTLKMTTYLDSKIKNWPFDWWRGNNG